MCGRCYELCYSFSELKQHNKEVHNNNHLPHNKAPIQVCESCGSLFLRKRYSYKSPQLYCCQGCYLETSNPRKSPSIIAKIADKNRGEHNASKRTEVRALISAKLKGRDAWWTRGELSSSKRLDVREKIGEAKVAQWQDDEWVSEMLVTFRDGGLFGYSVEGVEHHQMKEYVVNHFGRLGFKSEKEKPIKIGGEWFIVDVVVFRNGKGDMAVECGDCKLSKLEKLRLKYPIVLHIPYGENIKEVLSNV